MGVEMKPYKNEPPAVFFDLDIKTLSCAIQERAAILEYDAGMTREEAENAAARAYGYRDWKDYEDDNNKIKGRTSKRNN